MSVDNNWIVSMKGGGADILGYDSFVGLEYEKSQALPEKPVEDGAFFTANKWSKPYRVTLTLAKGGDAAAIREFITRLEKYNESIDLVDVVTPLKVFVNGTIESVRYSVGNDEYGPRLVMPRITIKEVLPTRSASTGGEIRFGKTKIADLADTATNGLQQAVETAIGFF